MWGAAPAPARADGASPGPAPGLGGSSKRASPWLGGWGTPGPTLLDATAIVVAAAAGALAEPTGAGKAAKRIGPVASEGRRLDGAVASVLHGERLPGSGREPTPSLAGEKGTTSVSDATAGGDVDDAAAEGGAGSALSSSSESKVNMKGCLPRGAGQPPAPSAAGSSEQQGGGRVITQRTAAGQNAHSGCVCAQFTNRV